MRFLNRDAGLSQKNGMEETSEVVELLGLLLLDFCAGLESLPCEHVGGEAS